jgi:hypothetical protein
VESLQYSASLLADPRIALCIFPQGELLSYGTRPLGFRRGIERILVSITLYCRLDTESVAWAYEPGGGVLHESLQVRIHSTAYHAGMRRNQPGVTTGVAHLVMAGD